MNETLKKHSNIKIIGWTTLLIFGTVALLTLSQLIFIIPLHEKNPALQEFQAQGGEAVQAAMDMNQELNTATFLNIGLLLIASAFIASAMGLIKRKQWGRKFFHANSLFVLAILLGGVIYVWSNYMFIHEASPESPFDEVMYQIQSDVRKSQTLTSIFLLTGISWIIARINVLLFRKDYRIEFN